MTAITIEAPDELIHRVMATPEGHADPYPLYRRLREAAPVHRSGSLTPIMEDGLVFFYAGRRFATLARVLASRVIGLGNGPGGTTSYQSRLQFTGPSAEAAETLAHIVEQIEHERMRGWMSNASGDEGSRGRQHRDETDAQYFMRCRLSGRRHWTKCWTRDAAQPGDGFTVPAKLSDGEVGVLCEAYEKMDAAGRDLIRATASNAGVSDQSAIPSRP